MFFDADDYLRLRDRVAAAGCDTPIVAGVMPITTYGQIARCSQLSGAPFPPALAEQFEKIKTMPMRYAAWAWNRWVRCAAGC